MIKNWTDGTDWQDNFRDFYKYEVEEQEEIHRQLKEASGPLMLRNWMETRKFLIDYLRGSPSSPYFPADAIFVRDEYKEFSGNLSHIHLMLSMNLEDMTEDQKD